MESWQKTGIIVGIILIIIMLTIGVYFSFIYKPKNAYDVAWDIEDNLSTDVMETDEKITVEKSKDIKEEVKKELTVKEIIKEIEKAKPKFNLTIQPNLVVEYKDYTELEKADVEKVVNKLKSDGRIYPKTIELTEEDITRLQGYEVLEKGRFVSFENFDKERAKEWISKVDPISFPYYKNAKVEWLTDSKLVYRTAISQTGIRGILRIQYFEDENRFKAIANKVYEIDVEIVVSNTANYDNTTSMKLNEIRYLSNLKEVE